MIMRGCDFIRFSVFGLRQCCAHELMNWRENFRQSLRFALNSTQKIHIS